MIITKLLGLATVFTNKKTTFAILAVEMAILAYAISQRKGKKKNHKKLKKIGNQ
jgi:hypothetical protein